jgi:ATP-binding cassette subfamily B multidrug efflux pump
MRRLFRYLKPYSPLLLVMLVLLFGQTTANLALPDYLAKIVNDGIVKQDNGVVYRTGARMLLVALLGGACMVGVGFLASRIATGAVRSLRDDVFETVEGFSLLEFNRFSTASLITRSTNDMQQIQMVLVLLLRLALMAPFMGIGAVIKAYGLAPSMTWIMAVAIGILFVVIATLFMTTIPRFTRLQKLVDRLNLVTRENLTGLRVIRAFNREEQEEAKFAEANRDLTNANLVVNRLTAVMQPVMLLILNLTSVTVIWVGAHRIDAGTLQIGDMLAFMQYAMQAIFAFLMISMIFIMVPRAAVSARRVVEVLETEPSIRDPERPAAVPDRGGIVEFRGVSFAYPGAEEPVLRDVSFTALPGETTAIVGPTGSGKSTLIALIERFYDVTAGQVLVDGIDVREMRQEALRAKIGYVSQRAVLFSGTVESNIRYGYEQASMDDIRRAARTAQATEFVERLDKGYEHAIAQGGMNVSGGQKQRLTIARAIARRPEIYVFDESFSALDFRTDAMLRAALGRETSNRTVLIVSQRISTIMGAEKIVVLDAGRVVGQGRHKELLRTCEVYREIAASQLSEAELAGAGVSGNGVVKATAGVGGGAGG